MVKKFINKLYLALFYLFLYLPIIFMVVYSFNESRYSSKFTKLSFKWYMDLFKDESVVRVFYQTLTITLISTSLALIIGVLGAFSIYKTFNKKLKVYLKNITYIPLILPDIVIAVGMIILYVFLNFEFGYFTIILSHVVFNVPFVVFTILPKLISFDSSLYDASMDLGARPFYIFRKIIFPQLIPNIFISALITITLSLDDFTVSYFTSGNGVMTLSVKIYSMTKRGISPKINALSTLMLGVVILISTIIYIVKKEKINGGKNEKNI